MLGMLAALILGAVMGNGVLIPAGAAGGPQDSPPPSRMQLSIIPTSLRASDGKIYVNENCEIFPNLTFPLLKTKLPLGVWNDDICRLRVIPPAPAPQSGSAGEPERSHGDLRDEEYILQNITWQPQIFAVLKVIPEGWQLDGEPKPAEIEADVAVFEIHAGPGQTVRLRVRMRYAKDGKANP